MFWGTPRPTPLLHADAEYNWDDVEQQVVVQQAMYGAAYDLPLPYLYSSAEELAYKDLCARDLVICPDTEGMFHVRRKEYTSSYHLNGVMFKWDDFVHIAQSTNITNRVSQMGIDAWAHFEVWRSYDSHYGHEGIPLTPPLDRCEKIEEGIKGLFGHIGHWQHIRDLEELLVAAGITNYVKFIAAYHIQGQKAMYPTAEGYEYCPLDWYTKVIPGMDTDDRWNRHVLLDKVSPKDWYASRSLEKKNSYEGWPGYRIGGVEVCTDA